MKSRSPRHAVVSPVTYFLSSLLLLGLILSARAQLPPGWTGAEIGTSTGGQSYSSGAYVISGLASGLATGYGSSENLHFTYQAVTGDYELVARLVSCNAATYQVGMMLQAGVTSGDPHGAAFYCPAFGSPPSKLLWTHTHGPLVDSSPYYYNVQDDSNSTRSLLNPPFWIKLVKLGNNYGAYWSLNGRNWVAFANTSGGAFFATGTYNIGFFITSGTAGTTASATFDNVYLGAPRLQYKTSWVGATSAGMADGSPSNAIYSLWVKPDGTCYTDSNWDEGGMAGKVYKDGKVFHGFMGLTGINGAYEGTVTGNATNIFYYNAVPAPRVCYTDFTTYVSPWGSGETNLTFSGTPLGDVRGLAASATRIFVSDYAHGLVRVVDAATHTEITSTVAPVMPIPLPRCGPITYDGTNFWVIQAATQDDTSHGLSSHTVGTYAPSILCFQPDGTPLTSKTITWTSPDTCIPTALAYQDLGTAGTTTDDVLWVCDNSPHQYIRKYNNLTGTPSAMTAFGQDGGIWAGGTPGLLTDSAAGGDKRFYGPVGVGTDSSGYIYVACNGGGGTTTDLRKFNSAGTLQWRVNGLCFIHGGDFDPASATGADYYTPEKHFTMNYANTAPGSEWSYQSFTRDMTHEALTRDQGAKLARVGGKLYMYTKQMGNVGTIGLFCFSGETAIRYGTYGGVNGTDLWIDANLNGTVDATPVNEASSAAASPTAGQIKSFDVDTAGDIWMCGGAAVRQVINQGTQTVSNGTNSYTVSKYSLTSGGYADYNIPAPLVTATQINYDRTNDVVYLVGQTGDGTWMLVRADQWRTNPESKNIPNATWAVKLPPQTDLTILLPPPNEFSYFGLDVTGGKAFVGETYGPIHVYDTALGNEEIALVPGPEISARAGWQDMTMGISAFKSSSGEYLVTEEDAGFNASDLLYRWTPAADTAATDAPVLTASAAGRKVLLSWAAPVGMVTSYKLYRGTSTGGETLYQSGIISPTFTDLKVAAGTTYYYKVTAVNAAGESAQSNEVSAIPAASQAEYVKTDTTTKGDWYTGTMPSATYVYGSEGYDIVHHSPDVASLPGYVTSVTTTDSTDGSWEADPSSDVKSLRLPNSTNRTAANRSCIGFGLDSWTWNVTFNDTKWHQVSVYCSYSPYPNNCLVEVLDASTSTVLDSRRVGNTLPGKWLVWNVCGNVKFHLVNNQSYSSGIFFDPVQVVATPTIGWWKLDETSGSVGSDSSGAGHNMSCGPTSGSWNSSGEIGGCFNLGGGSGTSFPAGIFTPLNDRTFCTWLKTTVSAPILGEQGSGFAPLLYIGTDGKLYGSFNTGTITPMVSSATTLTDNTWHHVALTRSGNVQTMYLDGNAVGMLVAPNIADYSASQMGSSYITGWPNLTNTNYSGKFDDVRIYDKALTPGQVYQLANP